MLVSVRIEVSEAAGDIVVSILTESLPVAVPLPEPQAVKKQTTTAVAKVNSLVFINVNLAVVIYKMVPRS